MEILRGTAHSRIRTWGFDITSGAVRTRFGRGNGLLLKKEGTRHDRFVVPITSRFEVAIAAAAQGRDRGAGSIISVN